MERTRTILRVSAVLALVVGGAFAVRSPPALAQTPAKVARYEMRFADGSRTPGETLVDWYKRDLVPKVDSQPIFDPEKPLAWLRSTAKPLGPLPTAFVEMFSGDRLPGEVVGYRLPSKDQLDTLPECWLVLPTIPLRPPTPPTQPVVLPVDARYVRRVVWQRRPGVSFQPATAWFRAGRPQAFRAARFEPGHVELLLDEGTRRVSFGELAELHLPLPDYWDAHFRELATLCPHGHGRLMQVETVSGLVATVSTSRITLPDGLPAKDVERWVYGLQPAWLHDVLWTPESDVAVRRFHAPSQIPLSRLVPLSGTARATFGGGRVGPVNRNLRDGPLRSGGVEAGSGWGVHAFSELVFRLPAGARTFRSEVGLDEVVGHGGCIQPFVFAVEESGGQGERGTGGAGDGPRLPVPPSPRPPLSPLFAGPVLVGSARLADTGVLALPSGPHGVELRLRVDTAHANRPAGADPFDVRDTADWLDPLVELDAAAALRELQLRSVPSHTAWTGWQVEPRDGLAWTNDWWAVGTRGRFVRGVTPTSLPLRVFRDLPLRPNDRWLVVSASQDAAKDQRPKLEVRLDGELAATFELPTRDRTREPAPLVLPLTQFRGAGTRHVELRQIDPLGTPVHWHGLATVEQLPTLHVAFEDDGRFEAQSLPAVPSPPDKPEPDKPVTEAAPPRPPPAELTSDDWYIGPRSVRLAGPGRFKLSWRPLTIRAQPGPGQFRQVRFAFRKLGGGRIGFEFHHNKEEQRPARYFAGTGEPVGLGAKHAVPSALTDRWTEVTRDLFLDYGDLELTGLTVTIPDANPAYFDHLWFAHALDDFRHTPPQVDPSFTGKQAGASFVANAVTAAARSVVAIESGGQWSGGAIVTPDGYVLTAGHTLAGESSASKMVSVRLADGRVVPAQPRGILRDGDLGLVKLVGDGPWPHTELGSVPALLTTELYGGYVLPRVPPPGQPPTTLTVRVRRPGVESSWTDADAEDYCVGTPLIDRQGRVVGVFTHRSLFGGFCYTKVTDPARYFERLKNGDVWGRWLPGTEPRVGAGLAPQETEISPQGTQVGRAIRAVTADSPAARAGLKPGDILVRVDGRPVTGPDSLMEAAAERDPGQELGLEMHRPSGVTMLKLRLSVRRP